MATKEEVLAEFAKQNEAIAAQGESLANIAADIDRLLEDAGIPDDVLTAAKEQTAKIQATADSMKALADQNPETTEG